jgi:hypothetical protein
MIQLDTTNIIHDLKNLFFECFFTFEQQKDCNIVYVSSNANSIEEKGFGASIYDFGMGCKINIEYLLNGVYKRISSTSSVEEWLESGIYEHTKRFGIIGQYEISRNPKDLGLFHYTGISLDDCRLMLFNVKLMYKECAFNFSTKNIRIENGKICYKF